MSSVDRCSSRQRTHSDSHSADNSIVCNGSGTGNRHLVRRLSEPGLNPQIVYQKWLDDDRESGDHVINRNRSKRIEYRKSMSYDSVSNDQQVAVRTDVTDIILLVCIR